jgi:hypothetical protein
MATLRSVRVNMWVPPGNVLKPTVNSVTPIARGRARIAPLILAAYPVR